MNAGLCAILALISYMVTYICGIWAIVEFVIYLVKDDPFNWWSIVFIVIFAICTFLFWLGFEIGK